MPLNPSSGNMYGFVKFTWNPVKGCRHGCSYCYLKSIGGGRYDMTPRLDERELLTDLSPAVDACIFVGSTTDLFGKFVPDEWIYKVLERCRAFPKVNFLFQSKNPDRMRLFTPFLPARVILGTTIESNRDYPGISGGASVRDRYEAIKRLRGMGYATMITIEPILDFDVGEFARCLSELKDMKIPNRAELLINIGADSKGHDAEKIGLFLFHLAQAGITVNSKSNLLRLKK
jgi:DNA repair photolyase